MWIKLEPIFHYLDMVKRMPLEGGIFREINGNWRYVMERINDDPKILYITKNRKFLENLTQCYEGLEICN